MYVKMIFRCSFLIVWVFFLEHNVHAAGKVSCFYNSSAHWRKGPSQVTYEMIEPALSYCTHVVYTYLEIDQHSYEVKFLDPGLDVKSELQNFQKVVKPKSRTPPIKTLLSIGGIHNIMPHVYFKVLETNDSRAKFIKSLVSLVEESDFDGADLAWPFPTSEKEKNETIPDTSVDFVKEHFGCLVEELSAELTNRQRLLTLSVVPYIEINAYLALDTIKNCTEHIHLMTFDYNTPWRNPNKADYAAPMCSLRNRTENRNVAQNVNYWMKHGVPVEKLLIAIPTFGRSWKIDNPPFRMKPPIKANGPADPFSHFNDPGTIPYYELCSVLVQKDQHRDPNKLTRVLDRLNTRTYGPYAYRRGGNYQALWVSYENPRTAAEKAKFAKRVRLGGVAVVDLSLDDFRGKCDTGAHLPFSLLRAARDNLVI